MERECKNCGQVLYAQHDFCFRCGAKWIDYRLTPKSIAQEVTNRYLGIDNRFLRTLVALVTHPHHVIDGYVQGIRRKFISPINFYVISLSLIGLQVFAIKNFTDQTFVGNAQGIPENVVAGIDKVMDFLGLINTVNLPIYALAGYIVYKNCRKYNFTEHLILQVYVFGFFNIFSSIVVILAVPLLGADFGMVNVLIAPLSFVHMFFAYHKVFDLSWSRSIFKMILYLFLSSTLYFLLLTILTTLAVLIVIKFYPEVVENIQLEVNGKTM